jgi:hypothetical protein
MNLLSYNLFTTDAEQFIDNLSDFVDNMLNDNDLPDNMDTDTSGGGCDGRKDATGDRRADV